jgi:hypothetical protein
LGLRGSYVPRPQGEKRPADVIGAAIPDPSLSGSTGRNRRRIASRFLVITFDRTCRVARPFLNHSPHIKNVGGLTMGPVGSVLEIEAMGYKACRDIYRLSSILREYADIR